MEAHVTWQYKRGRSNIGHAKPKLYGYTFDSGLERDVYLMLKDSPDYTEVQVKDHVYLTRARILLIADFKITELSGAERWIEAKGFETPEWRIKRRLWKHYGPGPLEIWKRQGKKGLVLHETIIPVGEA